MKKQLRRTTKDQPTLELEKLLTAAGINKIAGVDEAGRGAWAGPVVAAAVILPELSLNLGINDSKVLTPIQRAELYEVITKTAEAVGVGVASVEEIDKLGVGRATYLAMHRAIEQLTTNPGFIIVDGFKVNFPNVPSGGVIDGDAKSLSVAAASIIAKVYRDNLMVEAHTQYPRFGFAIHKGYGTVLHQERITKHGICKLHRRSFAPIKLVAGRLEEQVSYLTVEEDIG